MTETSSKSGSTVQRQRLGMCEVCAATEARYACPKCEVKTCCLACVQIHKKELACDGQRDRTKFVPLSEMTAREFMSDYCFLEECTRYAENRKSDRSKRYTRDNTSGGKGLSMAKHRLRSAALSRNIRLMLQLPGFSRHKENTTYLNWKLSRLYWRVEWLFVNIPMAEDEPVARFVDARCDEKVSLADLALKYVDLQQETARNHRRRLVHHQTAGIGQLSFWLRAEGVRRSSARCYALEAATALGENLAGRTIVEFPTIYVTYEAKPPLGLEVIDSGGFSLELVSCEAFLSSIFCYLLDEELEEEVVSPPVAKKAKEEEEEPLQHDVFHGLATAFAGEDASEPEDDDEEDADLALAAIYGEEGNT